MNFQKIFLEYSSTDYLVMFPVCTMRVAGYSNDEI